MRSPHLKTQAGIETLRGMGHSMREFVAFFAPTRSERLFGIIPNSRASTSLRGLLLELVRKIAVVETLAAQAVE